MRLRDSLSTAATKATETAAEATETVSERTGETRARVTETASAATARATDRAAESDLPDRLALPGTADAVRTRAAETLAGVSLPNDPLPNDPSPRGFPAALPTADAVPEGAGTAGTAVGPVAREYARRTLAALRRADLTRTYRYGRMGFSYGGTCGQYVPFGTALPYVGLVAGVGAGVLDEIDLLPTDALRELSREVEAMLAPESIGADPADLPRDPTDVDPTAPDGPAPGELAEMDYEEFAGK